MAAIRADNVGVTFRVYGVNSRSLRHSLLPSRPNRNISRSGSDIVEVEALKNVSFELKKGDRLGLVGRNGSGKTTLLRVIGGIYEPTTGVMQVDGKLAALTDMGLGMDPETSGYENILTRCICMGMTMKEAKETVAEIESFTELGQYLALPVRTYSSGMTVRLAFAISTNIDPEILVMDEMVGAGDIHFVEKARQRVKSIIDNLGILVIASHNSDIVRQFCNKAALLKQGEIVEYGEVDDVLKTYESGAD